MLTKQKIQKFQVTFIIEVESDRLSNDEASAIGDVETIVNSRWDDGDPAGDLGIHDSYNFQIEKL